jgi:hypothetical protein
MAEIVFVQGLRVLASTREPGSDGRLSVAEEKTRSAAEASSPPESAESTIAIWCEGGSDGTRAYRVER